MENLKQEWLEKIKIKERRNVSSKYGMFTVMTDFYQAPEEFRKLKEF